MLISPIMGPILGMTMGYRVMDWPLFKTGFINECKMAFASYFIGCIFGFLLGDVGNTTNVKTAAAARKQAPVVAHNVLATRGLVKGLAKYDEYGSCPLTVERGKIVLAEFTYGGKLAPSFPKWLIDGTESSAVAWYSKERILPPLYWDAMLKGREWMAQPEMVDQ
jgi:sulfide:quinone oxidoreductase